MRSFSAALIAAGLASCAALSPVTRVVELLQGLSKQVETEAKTEEDLYEAFVCWGKSILRQKTETNQVATARIQELETYVADLDAGRIELTTERVDLDKEIAGLEEDLQIATNLREKEAADFEEARDEMQKAIDALSQAIQVLKEATENHRQGVLLSLRGGAGSGEDAAQRTAEGARMKLAVELGQRVLTRGDSVFLQRLLTGEVPESDWKKLNRKATFKMDYKARSFEIQEVLQKMKSTFESNLADATAKEDEAIKLYGTLKDAKDAELSSAKEARAKLAKENGARALSKDEANAEITALKKQVDDDLMYMDQVQKALDAKKAEWKDRKVLRAGELEAISKAIAILHSDDARDLFKRSFASQEGAMSFLQERASSRSGLRRSAAADALAAAAAASRDGRLAALAAGTAKGSHFDEVIEAIDTMVVNLQAEEASDLKIKETCESGRMNNTRDAAEASRTIDEHTEAIVAFKAEVEKLARLIEEHTARVAQIVEQLAEARAQREKEHEEYKIARKDDEDAASLIDHARLTLEQFYKDNHMMLLQTRKQAPYATQAGQAPPPPPPTWEGGYGGRTEESTGIVSILEMIHEDALKDIAKAEEEEAASLALYEKTKAALDQEQKDLEAAIDAAEVEKSDAEESIVDEKGERRAKMGELDAIMKTIRDAEPGCAYFQVNYPLRVRNRQIEIDGLQKAKAILSGGVFDAPDPNREIRPGDALLLQRPRLLVEARRVAV